MHKQKIFHSLVIFFISALAISSCSNYGADESGEPSTNSTKDSPGKKLAFGGYLDTLYATKADFLKLDSTPRKNLILSFVFKAEGSVTLHGWLFKPGGGPNNPQFSDSPNIILQSGAKSSAKFGVGTYFGNLTLDKRDIDKIAQKLNSTGSQLKFVMFIPKDTLNNIFYNIALTDTDPSQISTTDKNIEYTDLFMNPSPPKNFPPN